MSCPSDMKKLKLSTTTTLRPTRTRTRTSCCMFVTSLSEEDQKKLGKGALMGLACCLTLITFTFCTALFNPTFLIGLGPTQFPAVPPTPPPAVKLVQSISSAAADLKLIKSTQEIISRPPNQSSGLEMEDDDAQRSGSSSSRRVVKPRLGIHNFSSSRSHVYELKGDIRIHGNSSTIFVISSTSSSASWITKPYARNFDKVAMRKVSGFEIRIIDTIGINNTSNCGPNFSLPAIIFSTGGYSGNPFHDFTDVLIPLYLTSRQLNTKVVFVVADRRSWWTSKYRLILEKLSGYDLVDIRNASRHVNEVLCFSRVIVGLKAHRELSIDPSKPPYDSVREFTEFLRTTYSLDRHNRVPVQQVEVDHHHRRRPRLLIVSRKKTRRLTNAGEVAALGRRLGFHVVVSEMGWDVSRVAALVNSVDVMVGVHGAGLTNMVFLPANAVLIQIVPIGVEMLAKQYFQGPAKDMGLKYIEYRVNLNESSLSSSSSLKSQSALLAVDNKENKENKEKGWHSFRSVYLDAQDIKLDVARFKETLSKTLDLVHFN